jgi:hypothetical protein
MAQAKTAGGILCKLESCLEIGKLKKAEAWLEDERKRPPTTGDGMPF